jgi:hypothetical protein
VHVAEGSARAPWRPPCAPDVAVERAYGFIGGGGVGIANAASIEEMHALLVQSPGFPIGDNEVRPLGELNETMEAGIVALRRVASMMPGPAS